MKKTPFFKRIGTRIIIFSTLVLVLAILSTGLMIVRISAGVLRSNISQRNREIARRTASEISLYINDSLDQLYSTSEIMATLADDPLLRNIILENLSMNLDKYRCIYLLDRQGNIITSSNLVMIDSHQFDPIAAKEAVEQDLYISAVKLSDDNLPYITIALPVKAMGEKISILAAELNIRDIWDIVDDISIGESGGAFLVSQHGLLIAHPDKTKVLKLFDGNRIPSDLSESGTVILQEQRSKPGLLMVYQPVESIDWIVGIQQPIKEAYLPVATVLWQSLLLIVIGIILSSIAGILLAAKVLKPLEKLLEGTLIVSDGELDHRVEIHTDDEIGRLTTAFNRMVERLKEQSRELQESEEEYRLLTDNVSDVVFSLDNGGRLLFINQRIESITGLNRNEFIGKRFLDLLTAESRDKVREKFQTLFTEKEQSSCHLEVSLPAGHRDETNFEIMLVKFSDPSGKIRYYGVARDMTERRKLQEQLIQTEKLSSLGEIISGVAHELNNPLTSIIGLSELILMEPGLNSEVKEELGEIRNEAKRTSRIVQNFLTFSRKYRPEKTVCRINKIIESILEIRIYEIMVSHIKILKNLDPKLPLTMADPNQLRQVFLNIINNAIQALQMVPKNRILSMSTKVRENKIEISFGNTGPVIPRDILAKIFDPFFTTKEVGKGTGLGLSVSHGIITEHGGSICVQSKDGEGTQFIIEIPLENIPANSKKVEEEKTIWNLPGKRILVVDDEASILKLISMILESAGSTVDAAGSGDKALAYLVENDYDLVISDLRMPGIDGWKLFDWVKQNRPHIVKKLIFISGDIMNPDAQTFFKDSELLYLKKPFSIDDLKKIVETSLEKQKDSLI